MKLKLLMALLLPTCLFSQTNIAVTNSSFETTTNWTAANASTNVDASGQTNNALSFTADAGSNASNLLTSDTFTIANNVNCIVSLWVKATVANQKVKMTVANNGSDVYTSAQINLAATQGTWQLISSNVFSSGAQADPSLWTINFTLPGGANKTLSFDELTITANPLTVNGNFETNFFHQTQALGLNNPYTKNQINPFILNGDFANSGSYSVQLTNVFSSGGKSTFNAKVGYQHLAETGKNYQGSVYVRASTGETVNVKASLFLNGIENKGDDIYTTVGDTWTKITSPIVTATTNDAAYVRLTSETENAVFYIDDVTLSKNITLSNNNLLLEKISITKEGVHIQKSDAEVFIFDVLGKTIIQQKVKTGNRLNFNFETSKIYLVTILNANGKRFTTKVLFNN
ncbi:carbohydrate binding domain-containing protein [Wenyingzhuangia aestuarii]|uniref:carbohydrate binding domain-containing protein n=1 Tax=Wenyingzhuangia aestuarii TaxID=1647582 RepID=UPI00143C8392|nr:carbohydrate binding domain-containing protein [Wenyingzhuangia aestuarii]NJB83501.1 hypothetical protein [Wenyingzhuangia aestuarii]